MEDKVIDVVSDAVKKFDAAHLIYSGLIVLAAVLVLIGLSVGFRRYKKRMVEPGDLHRRHTLTRIQRTLIAFVLLLAVLFVLQVNGVNVSAIMVIIGLMVIAAVLAVKDSLQDVFAGLGILMEKYFRVGDAVEFDGRAGIVVSFSPRTTKIEYLEDRSVESIANRHISRMRRLTHLVDIDLPLSYDEDRQTVFTALTAVCEEIGRLDGVEDCEFKGTQAFGESAVFYKIRFFCEPHDRPDIRRAVMATVQDGLARAGLQVPYNQLDVHTK